MSQMNLFHSEAKKKMVEYFHSRMKPHTKGSKILNFLTTDCCAKYPDGNFFKTVDKFEI